MNEVEKHNRTVMLNRVKTYWLKGVLEESLHGGELIDLSLAYRPSALADSEEPEWQQTAEYDIPLPFGTKISTVFSAANGELLILGEPGAGKTTMLLQLVSDLLIYAEGAASRPIPAVFSLASWSSDQTLDKWLINELSNNYEVPAQLSRTWITEKGFIPLLDGLDEVEKGQRTACADAINQFRRQYPGVWMLVTTRSKDYHALSTRLQLDKAIVLQPLNMAQIDTYLAGHGNRLEGLRATLKQDATMRELAQSPLMLSIMTLAYNRMSADAAPGFGSQEKGRELLFDVYVDRMSRYRGGEKEFPPQATVQWLSWLATMMERKNRAMFFLENIQPDWLPQREARQFIRSMQGFTLILFVGCGALAGLFGLPHYGLISIAAGLIAGFLAGLLPILSKRFLLKTRFAWDRIDTVETLGYSWPWTWLGLGSGVVLGLAAGLSISWVDNFIGGGSDIPWLLLLPPFFAAGIILDRAIIRSEVKIRTSASMGLKRSRHNGFRVGLAAAIGTLFLTVLTLCTASLIGFSIPWLATLPWIVGGVLFLGLNAGLAYGGFVILQYKCLRSMLYRLGLTPNEYVRFLDYAAERSLLRKVGGGYTFMHALLLDYFVKRNEVKNSSNPMS